MQTQYFIIGSFALVLFGLLGLTGLSLLQAKKARQALWVKKSNKK